MKLYKYHSIDELWFTLDIILKESLEQRLIEINNINKLIKNIYWDDEKSINKYQRGLKSADEKSNSTFYRTHYRKSHFTQLNHPVL